MSKKRSESSLPDDALTQTEGSNYGMDGFPEMDYGAGLDDSDSSLISFADDDFDEGTSSLNEFFRSGSAIQDLSWLEMTNDEMKEERDRAEGIEQSEASGNALEELALQWEVNRPQAGTHFQANVDVNIARGRREFAEGPVPKQAFSREELLDEVRSVMRKSAAGHSLHDILSETAARLGYDAPQIKKAVEQVVEEHGLAGRVFIRAAAYPGCSKGKWTKQVKSRAAEAQFVVEKSACSGCKFAQQGVCAVFQKKLVPEVDWEEARKVYAGRLAATGRKVASKGDPKEAIRKAFSQEPRGMDIPKTSFERHVAPADTISIGDALKKFSGMKREHIKVSEKERQQQRLMNKARAQIARWVKAGTITDEQAGAILNAENPVAMVKEVSKKLASQQTPKASQYSGAKIRENEYRSTGIPDAPVEDRQVLKLARYARRHMSEGVAGNTLTALIRQRFAPDVLKKGAAKLAELRREHEGLSGHLYVDAAAYASPTGTEGCEQGALKHRANALKTVLSMDRCGSCAFANKKADGTLVCQKYNKALVDEFAGETVKAYQQEQIRLANSPTRDIEMTAALFNPAEEFGLVNPLDGFDLEDERTAHDVLADADIELGEMLIDF